MNKLHAALCHLGLSDPDSACLYYPKVRDRDDVSVYRCSKSGVLFLSKTEHIENSYYDSKKALDYWEADSREQALAGTYEDDHRRAECFRSDIANRKWLDIGTGAGGILDLLGPIALETAAVEPQEGPRKALSQRGYQVYQDISSVRDASFDVITMFHVFEHVVQPMEMLEQVSGLLRTGGRVIVEVPHANDFLISTLDVDAFKAFTFWSEHLMLHTRQSLQTFLTHAGFQNITIQGIQRYPLANHLHWLAKQKPGGHAAWGYMRTSALEHAYADMLAKLDQTDTLIAIAEK